MDYFRIWHMRAGKNDLDVVRFLGSYFISFTQILFYYKFSQCASVLLHRDPIPHFISKCFLSKNNRWPSVFDREIQSGRVYLSLSSFSCYRILLLDNRKVFVQDTSVCHRYKNRRTFPCCITLIEWNFSEIMYLDLRL